MKEIDWRNLGNLPESAQHTAFAVLRAAAVDDCDNAEQVLSNLTVLDLSNNHIVDIDPLRSLPGLIELDLCCNQVVDIDPLRSLVGLARVYLAGNQIVDIDPLRSLVGLERLDLDGNQIVDISPLKSLSNLTGLRLNDNQIVDISPLKSLRNLTKLELGDNQIVDIGALKSLPNLTDLYLSDNQITDISPLKSLPLLEKVWIHDCFLPRKYFSSSQGLDPRWLLKERNTAVRRALLLMIGYERICQELKAEELDSWREYSLVQIQDVDVEPVCLLKMICPSTGHVHVLRVPPDVRSAREAAGWVNWGVDPQDFSVET